MSDAQVAGDHHTCTDAETQLVGQVPDILVVRSSSHGTAVERRNGNARNPTFKCRLKLLPVPLIARRVCGLDGEYVANGLEYVYST